MSKRRLAVTGVGALSAVLTAGVLLAPTASATGGENSAFAISANGLLKIAPTPYVDDTNGATEESVVRLDVPQNLLSLGVLNARAGDGYAKSSIADLRVSLNALPDLGLGLSQPLVAAEAIEANCEDGVASSSVAGASVAGIALDVAAPPNTAIEVPGLASVTLNKQVTNDDGSTTVTAISIKVNKLQSLDLASATCTKADDDGGKPSTPPTTPGDDDGDNGGDNGDDSNGGSGSQADKDGMAPVPTPVKGHLDVTG
ncbi:MULTISPECIES: choice-of-anchor P family protein [Prauserella]|uniref:choice-of-anchor P family protein n=1 Tax=Prauserella TaxID=142577 RepID=UPI000D94C0D8|nr:MULTISPECIES: choice-of-anchor P family protein [Prauserella]PXY34301.1 hypothetical protein BAY59_01795 [Prauserella coralliicola]